MLDTHTNEFLRISELLQNPPGLFFSLRQIFDLRLQTGCEIKLVPPVANDSSRTFPPPPRISHRHEYPDRFLRSDRLRISGGARFPAIDPPNITVRTNYTGANAEVVESQITEPLEKAINGIAGIRTISTLRPWATATSPSRIDLDVDLEQAANDVRDKVSQAQRNLPQDIDAPPVVTKADASGDPSCLCPSRAARATSWNFRITRRT